jgi:hypothetical protein
MYRKYFCGAAKPIISRKERLVGLKSVFLKKPVTATVYSNRFFNIKYYALANISS